MKNFLNLGFIVLILVVLGCKCSGLDEFTKSKDSTPLPTLGTTPTPAVTPTPSSAPSASDTLTKEKFAQLKTGMSYKQVVEIIGSEGEETSSSQVGRFKLSTYKWQAPKFQMIICSFNNDKMSSKTQANLK